MFYILIPLDHLKRPVHLLTPHSVNRPLDVSLQSLFKVIILLCLDKVWGDVELDLAAKLRLIPMLSCAILISAERFY